MCSGWRTGSVSAARLLGEGEWSKTSYRRSCYRQRTGDEARKYQILGGGSCQARRIVSKQAGQWEHAWQGAVWLERTQRPEWPRRQLGVQGQSTGLRGLKRVIVPQSLQQTRWGSSAEWNGVQVGWDAGRNQETGGDYAAPHTPVSWG